MMPSVESQSAKSDFEDEIIQLRKASFAALKDTGAAQRANDEAAERDAGKRLVQAELEMISRLKAEEKKLKALLKLPANADREAKIAQLLTAFRHGAKLYRVWIDYMVERGPGNRVLKLTHSVLPLLRSIGCDRLALEPLLDDKDINVRAMAASALSEDLPNRALPILEEISNTGRWLSAGWTAMAALSMHNTGMARVANKMSDRS
jgi:hypothetical protein